MDDSTWARIFSFLKSQPDVRIANPKQCRRFLEAVLWITRTGAQWRELPSQFGKWNTIYKRYRRWFRRGIWKCFFNKLKYDRRVFSRFDKTDVSYLGFVEFASSLIWLR